MGSNNGLLSSINYMIMCIVDDGKSKYSLASKWCNDYTMNYVHYTMYSLYMYKMKMKKKLGIGYIKSVLDSKNNRDAFAKIEKDYHIITRDEMELNGHTIYSLPEYMLTASERRLLESTSLNLSHVTEQQTDDVRKFIIG